MSDIAQTIRAYILEEFLPGEDPAELLNTTPLLAHGILDSVGTLKLVSYLEDEFDIEVAPHEVDEEYLGTIDTIAALVQERQG